MKTREDEDGESGEEGSGWEWRGVEGSGGERRGEVERGGQVGRQIGG